jgi:hypothetical protein
LSDLFQPEPFHLQLVQEATFLSSTQLEPVFAVLQYQQGLPWTSRICHIRHDGSRAG